MAAWSGLFDGVYKESYALQFTRNSQEKLLRQALRTRSLAPTKALLLALLGVVPGSAAASSYSRVKANEGGPGYDMQNFGLVPIETQTDLSRNTTAADVTNISAIINAGPGITLVTDTGGNVVRGDPRYVN